MGEEPTLGQLRDLAEHKAALARFAGKQPEGANENLRKERQREDLRPVYGPADGIAGRDGVRDTCLRPRTNGLPGLTRKWLSMPAWHTRPYGMARRAERSQQC